MAKKISTFSAEEKIGAMGALTCAAAMLSHGFTHPDIQDSWSLETKTSYVLVNVIEVPVELVELIIAGAKEVNFFS